MKRALSLLCVFLLLFSTSSAQELKGDLNNDGKISVLDVTKLVDVIMGKSNAENYNHEIAGTWRTINGDNFTLKEDGSACNNGIESTYAFIPSNSVLLFYNTAKVLFDAYNIQAIGNDVLFLQKCGENDSKGYYRGDSYFVTDISLSEKSLSLGTGTTTRLTAIVYPSTAVERSVLWNSSDESIATVDEDGNVNAISPGIATITATSKDYTNISATCLVNVYQLVTAITLSQTSLDLDIDGFAKITAVVTPSNSRNTSVSWISSDESVAEVSSRGVVSANGYGTCMITCIANDGSGVSASCKLTVSDKNNKKWKENIFTKGVPVDIPLNINTDGVTVTSIGREFMGVSVDVSYDTYEEGELDWKNGTKLVFTAKDNITGIVIDGQWKEFAEADKGAYNNGAWTGTLAAGETLTLTANDGINIHSITVLYNGAELGVEDVEDIEATITFDITKTSWAKIGAMNGESIGTVSTDLKNFDHYMFMVTNDDDPAQTITFNDLLTIKGEMKCYSLDANGYDLYNGQNYTLHIYAYDTAQYGALAAAEAEYHFVGTGKEGTVYNKDITVLGVSLKVNAQGGGYNLNGTKFDVMFSAPVASVSAWWAKGFEGAIKFSAVKKSNDGTVWTIIMDESVPNTNGEICIYIIATDEDGHQLSSACESTPYGLIAINYNATLAIGNEVITLSEHNAVALATIPEGTTISLYNDEYDIKRISFELVDLTTNELFASSRDLIKGEDGFWTVAVSRTYELAKDHEYSIHIIARDGMSTFTSNILHEYNLKLLGTSSPFTHNGHEYVDLGLSVKWATCNLGAGSLQESGDMFRWGEIEPCGEDYNWGKYKWVSNGTDSWKYITKYAVPDGCFDATWYNNGIFIGDNKTFLDIEDDAAHMSWGGAWRMPSKVDFTELVTNCNVKRDGYFYVFTSKIEGYQDRSVSFPVTRSSLAPFVVWSYWSNTLSSETKNAIMLFDVVGEDLGGLMDCQARERYEMGNIRPVCP